MSRYQKLRPQAEFLNNKSLNACSIPTLWSGFRKLTLAFFDLAQNQNA